jgi:hypothetical protein
MTTRLCLEATQDRPSPKVRPALFGSSGQGLVEFAVILPFLLLVVLGVTELGYALLDQHVITRLSREGSNLISRGTSLQDAAMALRGMSSRPVDFDRNSKVIFSVLRNVSTTGSGNFNQVVLYQRYEYGTLAAQSRFSTRGSGSFGDGPEYQAQNSDNDTNLQIDNMPPNLSVGLGGMIYVTEVFTSHPLITPLDRFGVTVPSVLYSIAYF